MASSEGRVAGGTRRRGDVLLLMDAGRPRASYRGGVSRAGQLLSRHGLDLLVVVTAVVTAVGTVAREDLVHPDGPRFVIGLVGITSAVLVLLARRRFPFAAPATTWLLCSALSFMDAQLVVNGAGILIAGMGAAVLLGAQRNVALSRLGLAIVVSGSVVVVGNGPSSTSDDLVSVPAMFAIGWLVGWALRERTRADRGGRGACASARSGSGRPPPGSRSPRSAAASRASCTTWSPTRSA